MSLSQASALSSSPSGRPSSRRRVLTSCASILSRNSSSSRRSSRSCSGFAGPTSRVSPGSSYALFDRELDPGETRDFGAANADELREERRELELFRERIDAQLVKTRRLLEGRPEGELLSAEACERLKALGYIVPGCS